MASMSAHFLSAPTKVLSTQSAMRKRWKILSSGAASLYMREKRLRQRHCRTVLKRRCVEPNSEQKLIHSIESKNSSQHNQAKKAHKNG
jgi:hypothetical protein